MNSKSTVIIGSVEWQEMKASAPYDMQEKMEQQELEVKKLREKFFPNPTGAKRIEELKAELKRLQDEN